MKKLIAIVSVIAMLAGLMTGLTACGSKSSDSGDGTVLTFWTHNDEDTWNESYQGIVDAYMEEHPDVQGGRC